MKTNAFGIFTHNNNYRYQIVYSSTVGRKIAVT